MPKLRYAALFATGLLAACHHEPTGEIAPQCPGPTASATGRVVVQYREVLSPTAAPAPALRCRDDERHPCGNYFLPQTTTATSASLSISFGTPVASVICLTTLDYAYNNQLDLGGLALGQYAVSWQAAGRTTTGTLNVLANRVEVQSCDSNTVAVRYPVTYRIPATALWGACYARTAAAQAAVPALLDSLRREGAQVLSLAPSAHYSFFNTDAAGQLIVAQGLQAGQPATAVATPILLSFSGNFARLKAVVRRKPQAADLSVSLSSAHGDYAY